MTAREKLIEIALAELGYKEKAGPAELEDAAANPGSGNYTKYARDLDAVPGFYNGPKQGQPWCDVFADWCFVQAFGPEAGRKALRQPEKSCGAGCRFSMGYYRDAGAFSKEGLPGDQVFFGEKEAEHTGIAVRFTASSVFTVEGNSSAPGCGGAVVLKEHLLSEKTLLGYGRPEWPAGDFAPAAGEEAEEAAEENHWCSVLLPLLGYGSEGEAVVSLQQLLMGHGCSCGSAGADGELGRCTLQALRRFQSRRNLGENGTAGPETWSALLGVGA